MTTVTRLHRAVDCVTLADASRRFLRRDAFEPTTRDAYGRTLAALADVVGADTDVAAVTTEQLEDELLDTVGRRRGHHLQPAPVGAAELPRLVRRRRLPRHLAGRAARVTTSADSWFTRVRLRDR